MQCAPPTSVWFRQLLVLQSCCPRGRRCHPTYTRARAYALSPNHDHHTDWADGLAKKFDKKVMKSSLQAHAFAACFPCRIPLNEKITCITSFPSPAPTSAPSPVAQSLLGPESSPSNLCCLPHARHAIDEKWICVFLDVWFAVNCPQACYLGSFFGLKFVHTSLFYRKSSRKPSLRHNMKSWSQRTIQIYRT